MLKYNNNHIFTGYLKQFLSSFNLPTCKIYTQEFAKHLEQYGTEDPRVLESFDTLNKDRLAVRINYLKNDEPHYYFSVKPSLDRTNLTWKQSSEAFYSSDKTVHGLTRTLNSPGGHYDTVTHEYLGEYLRFLRDYHNINLMSLYNCFNDKIYNNVYFNFELNPSTKARAIFDSQDSSYRIYAIPVKLFSEYTIAIDCDRGIELFCGFYSISTNVSKKAQQLAVKTYVKIGKAMFSQPFVYNKLTWPAADDFDSDGNIRTDTCTRWDVANREKDLKLFIKVPTSCKSSITILEGDYRTFNDVKYAPIGGKLTYLQNHSVLNFNAKGDGVDLNDYAFKPISKLQLLAFNTGESYPFADRLIEYLSGSVITPIDEIPDNIKRAQRVMEQNKNYFKIEGLWENKIQNILYDYLMNSGPIKVESDKETNKPILVDKRTGLHPRLGHANKSTLYDVLGYVDKDAEKWYASWKKVDGTATVDDNIQNVDIYNGLYDI